MRLASGSQLGTYEVLSSLGAGGMGEVYRAYDKKLKREVAIKVLPASLASDENTLARFEREALAVAALSHPNILAIFDFGSHSGISYAVMELLEGETLRDRLKAGPIAPKQAVALALQLMRGLAAAHEKGIIHRDLKPENLFIGKEDHLKILDFGLARQAHLSRSEDSSATLEDHHTKSGTVMGTVGYMSPEQARGQRVDHRSDLFSVGAILYEMLSGKKAFLKPSLAETMAAILMQEPPELSAAGGNIAPALEGIVKKCLDKQAERRYQSAREIAVALEELAFVSAPSISPASAEKGRPRLRYFLPTMLVLGLLIASVLLTRKYLQSPVLDDSAKIFSPSIAVLPFSNLSDAKEQDYFSDGLAEELIGLLSKIRELRVAGRISSFSFKGKNDDLASIGQKLHVETLLEGSVRRSGDRLRVSTRLVKVEDGFQIWAETYDRKMADVFAVQDEIAGAVVAALKVKLLPQERSLASPRRTSNTEAYNQFLMGRQFYNRQSNEGYRLAVAAFEKAVALDPGYAAAFAILSKTLAQRSDFAQSGMEKAEMQRRVVEAAERAVALDPSLAESYSARANARVYIVRDWAGAQSDLERAIDLNPQESSTYFTYGRLMARLGRLQEAIAAFRKAVELDPLWAGNMPPLGSYLAVNGQLAESRKVLTRSLEISPGGEWSSHFLGITALLEGKPEEALTIVAPANTALRLSIVALAQYDLGRPREAQQALDELITKYGHSNGFQVAKVYARRREIDKAFEWLDRAFEQNDSQLGTIKVDPILAPLQKDPRYKELLKKLRLPVE